jgi:hypothetical protein
MFFANESACMMAYNSEMEGSNELANHFTALCFKQCCSCVGVSLFLVSIRQQLPAPLAICSVTVIEQCGTSWCGVL